MFKKIQCAVSCTNVNIYKYIVLHTTLSLIFNITFHRLLIFYILFLICTDYFMHSLFHHDGPYLIDASLIVVIPVFVVGAVGCSIGHVFA